MTKPVFVDENFVKVGSFDIKKYRRFWSVWSQLKTGYVCLAHFPSKKEAIIFCQDYLSKKS